MNILIISTSDLQGGAAIASFRLMNALIRRGEKVKMLVRDKRSDHPEVITTGNSLLHKLNFYQERAIIFLHNRLSRKNLFDISIANSGVSITEHPLFRQADVIHLHWINQGMLSLGEIACIIASGKKVVWTMHDMWPFTGICHHAAGCTLYEKGCGDCPYLAAPSPSDLSRQLFQKKIKAYGQGRITFVACSHWLKELAVKSPLTAGHKVIAIPNPIDTERYYPMDKRDLRRKRHLPESSKIILFAAVKASDPRKGMDYLVEASRIIAQQQRDILFLIAGSNGEEMRKRLSLPARSLGYVAPEEMPEIYNSADLFVTPSLQENLPNTIMEAMACGTPCIGFDTGGIPEMIAHGKNGYVAKYRDAEDLASGILRTLYAKEPETLSAYARHSVQSEYNQDKVANQYMEIYAKG